MAKITIAQQLATTLEQAGVKRIWGLTGDSLNGLTDALRKMDSIEWMHVRHEEVAAFAAGAEAEVTGGLTVCAGSCGPGNLHLINGLYDCHRNHVPVLAIAAQIPSSEVGLNYFQETHPQELFKECSHFVELVSNPAQMPQVLHRAMRSAILNRGVAVVVIPGDVALQEAMRWADGAAVRLSEKPAYARAAQWAPYRGVAAHLLWAWYGGVKSGEIAMEEVIMGSEDMTRGTQA